MGHAECTVKKENLNCGEGGGHEWLNLAEGGKIYKEETKVAGNTFRGWPRAEVTKQTDQR
jgi:hypothetical protein